MPKTNSRKYSEMTIEGILKDNPVPDGKDIEDLSDEEAEEYWGELIGILNKSFG